MILIILYSCFFSPGFKNENTCELNIGAEINRAMKPAALILENSDSPGFNWKKLEPLGALVSRIVSRVSENWKAKINATASEAKTIHAQFLISSKCSV